MSHTVAELESLELSVSELDEEVVGESIELTSVFFGKVLSTALMEPPVTAVTSYPVYPCYHLEIDRLCEGGLSFMTKF